MGPLRGDFRGVGGTQGTVAPAVLCLNHGGPYGANRRDPTPWPALSVDALK